MAAITINSRVDTVEGNHRVLYIDGTVATTGDTISKAALGYNNVISVQVTPETAVAAGATWSAGEITVYHATGQSADLQIRVVCN